MGRAPLRAPGQRTGCTILKPRLVTIHSRALGVSQLTRTSHRSGLWGRSFSLSYRQSGGRPVRRVPTDCVSSTPFSQHLAARHWKAASSSYSQLYFCPLLLLFLGSVVIWYNHTTRGTRSRTAFWLTCRSAWVSWRRTKLADLAPPTCSV